MPFIQKKLDEIPQKKIEYAARMKKYIDTYKTWMIINVDMVGSRQMQEVRIALRGRAVILMGKNTVMRRVVRDLAETDETLEPLLPYLHGNMGLVFTNESAADIRVAIESNKVPAAARVGIVSPIDVIIPSGATGLDPGQTSFFQVMNIATKIVKGTIELINQVALVKQGDKVSPSAVALLAKMNMRPFFFSITVLHVFEDGSLYDAAVLDITDDMLLGKFFNGVNKLACVSLAVGVPNAATLPHSFGRAIKYAVALAVETEITFEIAQKYKDYLSDPAAYAAEHGLSAGGATGGGAAAAAPEPEPEPEEEEEEEDLGFSLFD